jgi:hypothetical protein
MQLYSSWAYVLKSVSTFVNSLDIFSFVINETNTNVNIFPSSYDTQIKAENIVIIAKVVDSLVLLDLFDWYFFMFNNVPQSATGKLPSTSANKLQSIERECLINFTTQDIINGVTIFWTIIKICTGLKSGTLKTIIRQHG